MSKRPGTQNAVLSRLRRPVSRLRDMPIWSKLGLIMIVPTLATIVVGTNGLLDNLDTATSADRTRILSVLVKESGTLVDELQNERATATMLLGARDESTRKTAAASYELIAKQVEEAKRPYSQQRGALVDVDASLRDLLEGIDEGLQNLPSVRAQVRDGKVPLSTAALRYQVLIGDLLKIRDRAAQIAGGGELGDSLRAAAAVATTKEFLSQERVIVHRAFALAEFTPDLRRNFIATMTGQEQAQQSFESVATEADLDLYATQVTGTALRKAVKFQGELEALSGDKISTLSFTAAEWDVALHDHGGLLRKVERQLDSDVEATAGDLRDEVTQQVLVQTGLLLGMLLLAILFAWLVARSMARSLRELRHGALSIAQYGLPQAVARLRDPQLSSQLSPVQVANQIAEPLPVRSKDEFGQVTEAFNAVHLEAVRTAAEQAALRSSVATMFVNLARRSQILVDRLIGHLDRLERGEEDPDRLAELFQLDHLATRMRRNDENLLVLAGADSTRVQREPAALLDVLRAAQSEVEHYTRIEFGVIDRDIEVAAHAVNDLVHLIAELFDNATAFSPPDSTVMVEARRVGDRAVLYVEDHGIGISPDMLAEINEKLATPPMVDVAVSRMMGLVVVARLAARHGVKVELRLSADRGIIADVTLPTAVLVPRALAGGRGPGAPATGSRELPAFAGTAPQTRQQPTVPPQRSNFGTPLALESGAGAPSARPTVNGGSNGRGGLFDAPAAPPVTTPPATTGAPSRAGMPAWSDLTGAGTETGPRSGEPLPRRNSDLAAEAEPLRPEAYAQPQIPRQVPSTPEAPSWNQPSWNAAPSTATPDAPVSASPYSSPGMPISAVPVSAVPVSAAPVSAAPMSAPPVDVPAPAAPPAWPPVSREEVAASAADFTTEMPRIPAEYPVVDTRVPFADETMELPIFRELESAWFSTRRTAVDTPAQDHKTASPAAVPQDTTITAQFPAVDLDVQLGNGGPKIGGTSTTPSTDSPASRDVSMGSTVGGRTPSGYDIPQPYRPTWQTAADDGWAAASAIANRAPQADEATPAGLPKRTPMAQLVPGGVEKSTTTVQRRTPEGVRGLLSAYHRGVQRGRTQHKDDDVIPGSTETGSQSGKEQEA
ncbi:nitrate- and nitrite sensing domain-containing protein [Catellatospora sp. KI3]|uniref:sensor histidine kinase n=1 Tax=Catellatospora sp. KI3 TaxID=3041620 RepID=UPI0024832129|nr:nitrate- and nitrite sensing domain-containing protein [Catellatospora sp. KI3]MDI1459963.1 nitrate- and nitrite sensing domain-containing protein [Catellatospora sp. KI3]